MKLLKNWQNMLNNNRGSVIVVLALGMTVLLAGTALVTDIGQNYVIQGRLSVAADAAALAGGTKFSSGSDAVTQTVLAVAEKNGVPADQVIVEVDDDVKGVTVKARAPMKLFFARLFGAQGGIMEQRARVAMTRPIAFFNVFPLGLDESIKLEYNKKLDLYGQDLLGSGNWGALQFKLDGQYQTGSSILKENLKHGFPGLVTIGDIAQTESGAMTGPVNDAVKYRIGLAPTCTVDTFQSDCPRVLIMPIYAEIMDNNQNKTDKVDIVNFAAFYVDSIVGSGSKTEIWGYFIRPHVQAAASVEGESDYGLTSIKLVQ
jgi:hypothetical protein